jgi:hypothetical protein
MTLGQNRGGPISFSRAPQGIAPNHHRRRPRPPTLKASNAKAQATGLGTESRPTRTRPNGPQQRDAHPRHVPRRSVDAASRHIAPSPRPQSTAMFCPTPRCVVPTQAICHAAPEAHRYAHGRNVVPSKGVISRNPSSPSQVVPFHRKPPESPGSAE